MIIYLEGVDGSGKSTLAKTIEEINTTHRTVHLDGESRVQTKPNSSDRVTPTRLVENFYAMADSDDVYILDRGPLSDCIYRVFDDYKSVISVLEVFLHLANLSNRGQLLMIYCRNDQSEQKMLERGDDNPVALTKHKELSKVYDLVFDLIKRDLPFDKYIEYDYTDEKNVVDTLHTIRNFID